MKIGIIGAGKISELHIEAYRKNNAEILAICDLNQQRLESVADKYDIPNIYDDYMALLQNKEITAVSICTSNIMHEPITIAALNAGKHVLCEKPMALSLQGAKSMAKAAKEHNRHLMVGFVRRFGEDVSYTKQHIMKELGDIYYAKASYLRRFGVPSGWFVNPELSGGGAMIDLGIHLLDMVCYLCEDFEVESVCAVAFKKKYQSQFTAEELLSAQIRFKNGRILALDTSYCGHGENKNSVELYGTDSGVKIESEVTRYMHDHMKSEVRHISFDFEKGFEEEIRRFIQVVRGETDVYPTADQGVKIMEIIQAIYESARLGREVIL